MPLYIHNFIVLDFINFSHQFYSCIVLTDTLRLQIIVFSIFIHDIPEDGLCIAETCSITPV
jgi:hypothetical protein